MNILSTQTIIPVLIAIDSINLWDQKSAFIHPTTHKNIKPRALALIDVLQPYINTPPLHGITVLATTSVATSKYCTVYLENTTEYIVHHYNNIEQHAMVQHYHTSNYLYGIPTSELQMKLQGLSGNVGRELYIVAGMM